MKSAHRLKLCCLAGVMAFGIGCHEKGKADLPATSNSQPAPDYFKVDQAHSGSIGGTIHFTGKRPAAKPIDMSEDPACLEAHHGKAYDESLVVSPAGLVANAFIYI